MAAILKTAIDKLKISTKLTTLNRLLATVASFSNSYLRTMKLTISSSNLILKKPLGFEDEVESCTVRFEL